MTPIYFNSYNIPEYAIDYFINSSLDGLEDKELEILRKFETSLPYGYFEYPDNLFYLTIADTCLCSVTDKYDSCVKLKYFTYKKPSWDTETKWVNSIYSEVRSTIGYKNIAELEQLTKNHLGGKLGTVKMKVLIVNNIYNSLSKLRRNKDLDLLTHLESLKSYPMHKIYAQCLVAKYAEDSQLDFKILKDDYPLYMERLHYLYRKVLGVTPELNKHYLNY